MQPKQKSSRRKNKTAKGNLVTLNETIMDKDGKREQLQGRVAKRPLKSRTRKKTNSEGKPFYGPEPPPAAHAPLEVYAVVSSQGVNGESVSASIIDTVRPARSAHPIVEAAIFGKFNDDPRWPETFTMIPTIVTKGDAIGFMTLAGGSSGAADWGTSGMLGGSSFYQARHSQTLTTYNPAWNTGTYITSGSGGSTVYSRPVGLLGKIEFIGFDTEHSISICAVPTPPFALSTVAAHPTNYPTDIRTGIVSAQSALGGRSWTLRSGESIVLASLPVDPTSVTFTVESQERGVNGWTGWYFWIYGARATDRISLQCLSISEAFMNTDATGLSGSPWKGTSVPPDTPKLDKELGWLEKASEFGLSAYKASSKIIEGFSSIAALFGSSVVDRGLSAGCRPTGYINSIRATRMLQRAATLQSSTSSSSARDDDLVLVRKCVTQK